MIRRHIFADVTVTMMAILMATAATAQPVPDPEDPDLLGATCGQYQAALRAATPGPNAGPKAKDRAAAAQDDIASAMMWVHGFQSGRAGPGRMEPLTKAWMVDTVGKLSAACRTYSPNGKMRIARAAAKL